MREMEPDKSLQEYYITERRLNNV